ncbi:hypothetical protein RUM43_003533 [Polyplax serrata]|uniref:Homeodomain transcription factor n=1 Tax=Polyplax serrata TaxID=468196 RepID=A0AAN8NWW8_POLSC
MMLVLSIIHSQIVSTTNITPNFSKSRSKRRRIKRRNFGFDGKQEVYSSKESVSFISSSSKTRSGLKMQTVHDNSTRRKNIGWCIPLQSVTELRDVDCSYETDDVKELDAPENRSKHVDDDGFESLNSNGSSENGEENQDLSQGGQTLSDDEVGDGDAKYNVIKEGKVEEITAGFEDANPDDDEKEDEDENNMGKKSERLEDKKKDDLKCHENNLRINLKVKVEDCGFNDEETATVPKMVNNRTEASFPMLCRRQTSGLHSACDICERDTDHKDTDTDGSDDKHRTKKSMSPQRLLQRRRGSLTLQAKTSQSRYYNSSCESDDGEHFVGPNLTEGATSAAEWIGITTNSEECSITSEIEESDSPNESKVLDDHPFAWEFQLSPSMSSPSCASSDKVSCTIWENNDVKRADLSVLDISSAIIARVETMRESMDYFYVGIAVSSMIALLPSFRRLIEVTQDNSTSREATFQLDPILSLTTIDLTDDFFTKLNRSLLILLDTSFGSTFLERFVILSAVFERFVLSALFFFLVAVAERTFKQRFLYAKFFSRLTSFRRARKSELPHFRLNKVRNIKTWLSVRSYLKKRGPQRSVDVIVSTAFIITLLLLSFLSVELLKDSMRLHSECNLEAVVWCFVLGVYLLRFMTLGNKTNRKYKNLSVLLTEQINLYLQIEQKPHKKDELMVANSVLKLAADLLKELESPFKISGLSANPYVYTITKVVILSALSGVLSELLGFKLKLHKIKIK